MSLSREQIIEIVKAVKAETLTIDEAERYLFIGIYPDGVPKPATMTVVAYIAINEDGDVEASNDRKDALDRMSDSNGGMEVQVVKVTLTVPAPRTFETAITVEADKVETVKIEA